MRITREGLVRRWAVATLLALAVFAVLAWSDLRLKVLTGFSTADLQGFGGVGPYRAAMYVWAPLPYALRVGFNLGLDYLLMPLYAAAFFFAGILTREGFAPRPGRLRRLLTLLAAVPIAGAGLDAVENALELVLLLGGGGDTLARTAFAVSNAKWAALYVGVLLLAGAVLTLVQERQQRRLKKLSESDT